MRKRKPPVLLATVLVFMLVAVAIFFPKGTGGDGHGHDHDDEPQASNTPPPAADTGSRPKIEADQVATMAKGAMTKSVTGSVAPGGPAGNGSPSIALPKPTNHKPTPSDSSTSTQWYTPETNK